MSNDTNVFVYADHKYNKALPSGLVVEERIRLLLEIPLGECNYQVALL